MSEGSVGFQRPRYVTVSAFVGEIQLFAMPTDNNGFIHVNRLTLIFPALAGTN